MLLYSTVLLWLYYAYAQFFRYTFAISSIYLYDWMLMALLLISPVLHALKFSGSLARRSLNFSFDPLPESFFTEPLISKKNWIGVGVSCVLVLLFGVHAYISFSLLSFKIMALIILTITVLWFGLNRHNLFQLSNVLYMGLILTLCAFDAVCRSVDSMDTIRELVVYAFGEALPWLGFSCIYAAVLAVGCVLLRKAHAHKLVKEQPMLEC